MKVWNAGRRTGIQYSLDGVSITSVTIEVSPDSVEVIGFLAVARDPNGMYLLLLHIN